MTAGCDIGNPEENKFTFSGLDTSEIPKLKFLNPESKTFL
jgi:hypothetical protein